MLHVMLYDIIPANLRKPSKKQFVFRRKKRKKIFHKTPKLAIVGVYSLNFVECLALGVTFNEINDKNIQSLRVKMAAEILDEGGNTVLNSVGGKKITLCCI